MANLKLKSKQNKEAATFLIREGHYASSIHCLYYSAFQMIKHVLKNKCNIGYNEQKDQRVEDGKERKGSHEYVIDLILNNFGFDYREYGDFNDMIFELKHKRTESDYHNKKIDCDFAKESNQLLEDILTLLE